MVYRTLHFYILRELLRIFLLTAAALTTLLAFGGTFRPFTRQGIDIGQLMIVMLNLMPAMLAYAIPIAALFAAVLVYWRMSTDNELTACRAGGISFISIVLPAFMLGLAVASIDLGFVNYVVPRFLHSAERTVMRDLGSLIVSQIGRQEKVQFNKWVVYADSAELLPDSGPNKATVELYGMSAFIPFSPSNTAVVAARKATLHITNLPGQDAVQISTDVEDASAFDPNKAFQRVSGSISSFPPDGRPLILPSLLKTRPKFFNLRLLTKLLGDPTSYPPVEEVIQKIRNGYRNQQISHNLQEKAQTEFRAGRALEFKQSSIGTAVNTVKVFAATVTIDPQAPPDHCLTFAGKSDAPLRVEQYQQNRLQSTYTCEAADLQIIVDEFTGAGLGASLQLRGNVLRRDHVRDIKPTPVGAASVSGLMLEPGIKYVAQLDDQGVEDAEEMNSHRLIGYAKASPESGLRKQGAEADKVIDKLYLTIDSELHSRGSFSLSCLTLVLFGAALGILLRGKNPLAVFVLGFVPAIVLVLLITAGRELAEGTQATKNAGLVLIWAGNVVLLALVVGVYAKLLRH